MVKVFVYCIAFKRYLRHNTAHLCCSQLFKIPRHTTRKLATALLARKKYKIFKQSSAMFTGG